MLPCLLTEQGWGTGAKLDSTFMLFKFSSYFVVLFLFSFFLKKRFYLFIFRGEGREKERERNTNV